jgi:hypothetical protein
MANTVIGASVDIEFKSIKDLKTALSETEKQFQDMVDTFGEGSEQAQVAQKKLLSLQDGINQKTEEYNNKVDAAAATVSALNATVGGLQGALELTGLASEETEKALAKVTAALSVGDAIQNLTEFGPMIKTTFDTIKTSGVAAFQALKGAIGATGIGLLVIALGTIVAYWDDIKGAVSGVSDEQEKLNKQSKENLETQKGKLDAIGKQENILKLQGKSEKDILKLKLDQTNQAIKAAEINIKNSIATQKAQIAAAQRNKDILQGIITFITAPISALLKGVDLIGQAVGKNFDLVNKFAGGIASLVFDPEQTKADGDADIKAQQDALLELKNQAAGYQIQINDINKKGNEKKTADNKKTNDQIKKDNEAAIAAQKKAQEDLYRSNLSSRERDLYDLKTKYDQEKAIIEKGKKDASALTEIYNKDVAAINKKYDDLNEKARQEYLKRINELISRNQEEQSISEQDKARQAIIDKYAKEREETLKQYPNNLQLLILLKKNEQAELDKVDKEFKQKKAEEDAAKLLTESADQDLSFAERLAKIDERQKLESQLVFKSEEERTAFQKANIEARKKIAEEERHAVMESIDAVAQTLANASDLVGRNTAVGKAMAIASATISMLSSAQKAYEASIGIPFVGPVLAPINAALAIAAGIKNIREIAKVKIPGQGGGGQAPTPPSAMQTAAPMAPALSPAVQGQALNAEAINNLGNNAMRAYVLNSDIQNNDQRNAYLQRNARIG